MTTESKTENELADLDKASEITWTDVDEKTHVFEWKDGRLHSNYGLPDALFPVPRNDIRPPIVVNFKNDGEWQLRGYGGGQLATSKRLKSRFVVVAMAQEVARRLCELHADTEPRTIALRAEFAVATSKDNRTVSFKEAVAAAPTGDLSSDQLHEMVAVAKKLKDQTMVCKAVAALMIPGKFESLR